MFIVNITIHVVCTHYMHFMRRIVTFSLFCFLKSLWGLEHIFNLLETRRLRLFRDRENIVCLFNKTPLEHGAQIQMKEGRRPGMVNSSQDFATYSKMHNCFPVLNIAEN